MGDGTLRANRGRSQLRPDAQREMLHCAEQCTSNRVRTHCKKKQCTACKQDQTHHMERAAVRNVGIAGGKNGRYDDSHPHLMRPDSSPGICASGGMGVPVHVAHAPALRSASPNLCCQHTTAHAPPCWQDPQGCKRLPPRRTAAVRACGCMAAARAGAGVCGCIGVSVCVAC